MERSWFGGILACATLVAASVVTLGKLGAPFPGRYTFDVHHYKDGFDGVTATIKEQKFIVIRMDTWTGRVSTLNEGYTEMTELNPGQTIYRHPIGLPRAGWTDVAETEAEGEASDLLMKEQVKQEEEYRKRYRESK